MIFTVLPTTNEKRKNLLTNTAAVLLALLLWQLAAAGLGEKLLLPSPVTVAGRFFALILEKDFWKVLSFTFLRIAGGFFLGFGAGTLLAVLAGHFRPAEILLRPYMVTVKTVPVASFIVISLIWLSSRKLSVFISFLMVLPIVYNNLLEGIKSTDPKLLEAASLFRMKPWRRFRYITLPAVRPQLTAAAKTALGLSWKAGIAAEIIGIPDGSVGEQFYQAKIYLNTVDLFAWTVTVVLVSVLFEKLILFLLELFYRRLFSPGKGGRRR